tara:strand:+ start:519 stop:1130 length:612 start_codon:yes stop_codon:yes gene_type:complete
MKKTTLLIAFIAIPTSCSKDKDLLPVQQQPDNPSLRTSQDQHFLYNIEETHYNIKVAEFYQYHQNATYIPAEQNDIVEHFYYNKGGLKVANDGTGYLKSNIYPNDLLFPFRPWGSSTDYNHVFTFTMTDYTISNDIIVFDLYIVSCNGDTTSFNSTMKIIPLAIDNRIRLEQVCGGVNWDRNISYELEKTTNGNIHFLAEKQQ